MTGAVRQLIFAAVLLTVTVGPVRAQQAGDKDNDDRLIKLLHQRSFAQTLSPIVEAFLSEKGVLPRLGPYRPQENRIVNLKGLSLRMPPPRQGKPIVAGPVDLTLQANPFEKDEYLFNLASRDDRFTELMAAGTVNLLRRTGEVSTVEGRFDLGEKVLSIVPQYGDWLFKRFRPSGKVAFSGNAFLNARDVDHSSFYLRFLVEDLQFDVLPGLPLKATGIRQPEGPGPGGQAPVSTKAVTAVTVQYQWLLDRVDDVLFLKHGLYCGDVRGGFADGQLKAFVSLPWTHTVNENDRLFGNVQLVDCDASLLVPRLLGKDHPWGGRLDTMLDYRAPTGAFDKLVLDGTLHLKKWTTDKSPILKKLAEGGLPGMPADGTLTPGKGNAPSLYVEGKASGGVADISLMEVQLPGGGSLFAVGTIEAAGPIRLTCVSWTDGGRTVGLYGIEGRWNAPRVVSGDRIKKLPAAMARMLLREELKKVHNAFYRQHPRFDR